MNQISITEAQKRSSPNPISLICVKTQSGETNLTPVSWWTYISNNPAMLGFSVSKKSFCAELILLQRKFVLCLPGEAIAETTMKCGKVSGRQVNKSKVFDFNLTKTDIPFPVNSKLAFMCTIKASTEVGDHIFFACQINTIFYNEEEKQLFSWDGYSKLAII